MKTTTNWMMCAGRMVMALSLFSTLLLTACQQEDPVTPTGTSTSVDDHGSGGHGADDPPGDDNGGGN